LSCLPPKTSFPAGEKIRKAEESFKRKIFCNAKSSFGNINQPPRRHFEGNAHQTDFRRRTGACGYVTSDLTPKPYPLRKQQKG
jgi:hypothetical protein